MTAPSSGAQYLVAASNIVRAARHPPENGLVRVAGCEEALGLSNVYETPYPVVRPHVVELPAEETHEVLQHSAAMYVPGERPTTPYGDRPASGVPLAGHPTQQVSTGVHAQAITGGVAGEQESRSITRHPPEGESAGCALLIDGRAATGPSKQWRKPPPRGRIDRFHNFPRRLLRAEIFNNLLRKEQSNRSVFIVFRIVGFDNAIDVDDRVRTLFLECTTVHQFRKRCNGRVVVAPGFGKFTLTQIVQCGLCVVLAFDEVMPPRCPQVSSPFSEQLIIATTGGCKGGKRTRPSVCPIRRQSRKQVLPVRTAGKVPSHPTRARYQELRHLRRPSPAQALVRVWAPDARSPYRTLGN